MTYFESIKTDPSLFNRINAVTSGLQLGLLNEDLEAGVFIDQFAGLIVQSELSDSEKVGYFYLGLAGLVLPENHNNKLKFELVHRGLTQKSLIDLVAQEIDSNSTIKFSEFEIVLEKIPSDTLLIDVTHTQSFPTLSGVQRVVFETLRCFERSGKDYRLLKLDSFSRQLCLMSAEETTQFLNFAPARSHKCSTNSGSITSKNMTWTKVKRQIRRTLGDRLSNFIIRCLRTVTKSKLPRPPLSPPRILTRSPRKILRCPLIINHPVVLIEVAFNSDQVEAHLSIQTSLKSNLGMVAYDLIPIKNPEFCTVSLEFINYLRLYRSAKKISFISRFSQTDFLKYFDLVGCHKELKHKVHHLGSDLKTPVSLETVPKPTSLKIACIGTIEIRKNQVNVLRAARTLWSKNLEFKLTFAGNLGWKSEEFVKEYSEARAKGYDVEFRQNPTEEEIAQIYGEATFTVFPSLAEGYGLPVVESLNFNKPCITSSTSSLAEIAQGGGCVTIDPEHQQSLVESMELLLTEPELIEKLKTQINSREMKTWIQYSGEIFDFFRSG